MRAAPGAHWCGECTAAPVRETVRWAGYGLGVLVDTTIRQGEPDADLIDACGDDPGWLCEFVYDVTGNGFLAQISDRVVTVVFILLLAWVLSALARRHLARAIARMMAPDRAAAARHLNRLGIDSADTLIAPDLAGAATDPRRAARVNSITSVLGSTISIVIWSLAIMIALGQVGINLGPLIAGAGIAGVALGFGAQSLVKDFIAGLFMLIEDQYGIGDVVDLDEATGVVEKISLRTTVLRGLDGTVWHVPNGYVQRVGNMSQLWSVALVDVDVAYDSDLAEARRVILECGEEVTTREEWSDHVLEEPNLLGVEALGADGITIRMTVRTKPGSQWGLQRALREELKRALDGAGIEIPFPQRTVWFRQDGADV